MTVSRPWIRLDREKSPVQASVGLVNDLIASGRTDIISLSIGAETEKPGGKIGELLHFSDSFDPGYNSAVGGVKEVHEATASWINRFLGIPATRDNTFLVQTNGRSLLNHAFHIARTHVPRGKDALIAIPDTSWPMVDESAVDEDLAPAYYEVARGKLPEKVLETVRRYVVTPQGPYAFAAVYTNTPHNPTGIHIDAAEMKRMMGTLNTWNTMCAREDNRHNVITTEIQHIIDVPYFAACKQNSEPPYLRSGYETALETNCRTPWMAVVSWSKAFGTARGGLSAMVVHNSLIKEVSARLSRNNGFSYFPNLFANAVRMFHPDNDPEALDWFAHLADKYSTNRKLADNALGGMLRLVDGDGNMTALFEVPREFLGKKVHCQDGQTREIKDVNDVVEIVANHTGIVPVNNSTNREGVIRHYLRFALPKEPAVMEEAFQRIAGGLRDILNSRSGPYAAVPTGEATETAPVPL